MNELEQKRTAFQNVGSQARVEAVYGVAASISDGSRRDQYGPFCVKRHGALPPSAMGIGPSRHQCSVAIAARACDIAMTAPEPTDAEAVFTALSLAVAVYFSSYATEGYEPHKL